MVEELILGRKKYRGRQDFLCLGPAAPGRRSMLIVIVMIVVTILVPILLGLPSVFSSIPPLMIFIPAMLPFRIQFTPPLLGFVAVLAILLDRSV